MNLTWSKIPEDTFSRDVAQIFFSLHAAQLEIQKDIKKIRGLECVTYQRVFEDIGTKEPRRPTHGGGLRAVGELLGFCLCIVPAVPGL